MSRVIRHRFYCGAPLDGNFQRYSTIELAVAEARRKLANDHSRHEVTIVQVIRVVRRMEPPVEVEEVVGEEVRVTIGAEAE